MTHKEIVADALYEAKELVECDVNHRNQEIASYAARVMSALRNADTALTHLYDKDALLVKIEGMRKPSRLAGWAIHDAGRREALDAIVKELNK